MKISDRLEARFDTNEILKTSDGGSFSKVRVEPRLMQVLQILVENSPAVVSRQQLIEEVWDNYGGADEALSQAISHLRKILDDTDKENRIIETVVKKGYRFVYKHEAAAEQPIQRSGKKNHYLPWAIAFATVLICTFLFFALKNASKKNEDAVAPPATTYDEQDKVRRDSVVAPE